MLYALVLRLRHWGYDSGLLESSKGELPTFVLGNLHAGGTGKRLTLQSSWNFSLKTRRRKTRSPIKPRIQAKLKRILVVEIDTDWRLVGDEPSLLKAKHPQNPIFVCENRLQGISEIKAQYPDVKLVILDDGLQHRRLVPHKSFLILDSSRPLKDARLLPTGKLRDLKSRFGSFDAICIARSSDDTETEIENRDSKLIRPQFSLAK